MSNKKGGTATSTGRIAPPLKWHRLGGKHYLAPKIVAMMPPHTHYVEPYAGGLSVLLAKDPEGVSEVANDLNGDLMNLWRVLADRPLFEEFRRFMEATPFSEALWNDCDEYARRNGGCGPDAHPVLRASVFFVRCRQSLAGRMASFAPLSRTRTRGGMNEQASAWLTAVEGLPAVHARLKRVVILNRDALDVIRGQDGPETLFYLDPPYLHETRASTGEYAHEMNTEQHRDLLQTLFDIKGKFLLSGYRSKLYDTLASLGHWRRRQFELPNNAAAGKGKRTMVECVWSNFVPPG